MKIIKRGNPPEYKKVIRVCYNCDNTEFEYDTKDVHSDPRDGSYVICPVCGRFVSA